MFEQHAIVINGTSYAVQYDPSPAIGGQPTWNWYDASDILAPRPIRNQLNCHFIEHWSSELVQLLNDDERVGLATVLAEMGVSNSRLKHLGLVPRSQEEIDAEAREGRFKALPPAAHLPLNSPVLRDWFFPPPPPDQVKQSLKIELIGDGPFERHELLDFLRPRVHGCKIFGESPPEETTPVTPIQESPDAFLAYSVTEFLSEKIFVVGRYGFESEDLDGLIDDHIGNSLVIYSQEMLLARMVSGKDPFAAGLDVLSAFRVGHPALEYISRGWAGWASQHVEARRTASSNDSVPHAQSEGILSRLGYRVGDRGEPQSKRQQILREVFECDLWQLCTDLDSAYIAGWGAPYSPDRLKKIANSLAAFVANGTRRTAPPIHAISEWKADLEWLKSEYYHGSMSFEWPSTFVSRK